MNKKFLQSVVTGLVGLTLAVSCAQLGLKKQAHSCNATNSCNSKKEEGTKVAPVKKEKKAKKAAVKVEAVKTEEKKK